jgi:hypothetical protein
MKKKEQVSLNISELNPIIDHQNSRSMINTQIY